MALPADSSALSAGRPPPNPPTIHLGGIEVAGPREVVEKAAAIAEELGRIIEERKLYSAIRGRRYVHVEGWTTAAAMMGLVVREVMVEDMDPPNGDYRAVVDLVRAADGVAIGRASALCAADEPRWGELPKYARYSMALTRASSKACRLALSWIMHMAGYEVTPAEEIPDEAPARRPGAAPAAGRTGVTGGGATRPRLLESDYPRPEGPRTAGRN